MKIFFLIAALVFGSGIILGLILFFSRVDASEINNDMYYLKMIHSRDSQYQELQAKYDSMEWVNYNLTRRLQNVK